MYSYFYISGETLVDVSSEGFVLSNVLLSRLGCLYLQGDIQRCMLGGAKELWPEFVDGTKVQGNTQFLLGSSLCSQ